MLAVFQKVDVGDAGFGNGVPTRLACPPVAPQVQVSAVRGVSTRLCDRDGARFAMILWVAAFAKLIPLSCGNAKADSLADMRFVVLAAVGSAPNNLSVFHHHRARFYYIVQRMSAGVLTGFFHIRIICRHVQKCFSFRQIGVQNVCARKCHKKQVCHAEGREYNFAMTKFDSLYKEILARIVKDGVREVNTRTGHEVAALPGVHFSIDIEKEGFPLLTLRKIPVKMFVAEQIWFISGARKPADFLRDFTKIWDMFTNPADVVTVAYGYRWRKHFGRDQLGLLMQHLKKDPTSRHGVVITWDPASDGLGGTIKKNVPCPFAFTVNIIGGRLNLHNIVRSNDMVLGFPSDVAGFALLQCILAQKLGVKVGVYSHSISNAHMYDNQYAAVTEMLERTNDHPAINVVLPKNSFDRAERKDTKLVEEISASFASQYNPLPAISGLQIVL